MRSYRLTKRGKEIAKSPTQIRNELLDYLYDKKVATYEELTLVVGKAEVRRTLKEKIRQGLVEEVQGGGF